MNNNTPDKPTEESNWSGPSGERWLANVDPLEQMIRPIGQALIERAGVRPGERVIDIGCGAGEVSLEIARRVAPAGRVIGLDISPPLVAEATRRAAALTEPLPIEFVLGDAARTTLPAAAADCLVSRFGVMFFGDPFAAFSHLHSFLRPGGRFVFACWGALQDNAWTSEVRGVFAEHFELPTLPPRAPGPFAFADPMYPTELLHAGKFKDVEVAAWQGRIAIGGPGSDPGQATDFLMRATSLAKLIPDSPPTLRGVVINKLRDRLEKWMTPSGVQMPASVWLISSTA